MIIVSLIVIKFYVAYKATTKIFCNLYYIGNQNNMFRLKVKIGTVHNNVHNILGKTRWVKNIKQLIHRDMNKKQNEKKWVFCITIDITFCPLNIDYQRSINAIFLKTCFFLMYKYALRSIFFWKTSNS